MSDSLGWIIVAFALYLLMMVIVGAVYAKKNNSSEDCFLGGRQLNGWVAALSAQASDMSGWLLMGLPGNVWLGTGQAGIGAGAPPAPSQEMLREFADVKENRNIEA